MPASRQGAGRGVGRVGRIDRSEGRRVRLGKVGWQARAVDPLAQTKPLGLSLAPITGKMIAELISEKSSLPQHPLLSPDRYA